MSSKRWTIGMTGASGVRYGVRLIDVILDKLPHLSIDLIASESALRVLQEEEELKISYGANFVPQLLQRELTIAESSRINLLPIRDIGACISSGSYESAGMVIVPCSMKSLSAIAHGLSQNLIHRAADVTIKEGRNLVIVPRETPLSPIHLENMLKLSRLSGVRIVPAMPGFYSKPKSVDDMVNAMVMRILDQMGERIDIAERWK